MDNILFNAMLSKMQKEILKCQEKIDELYKVDMKYCKMNVEINKLVGIIENYKSKSFKAKNEEFAVFCNGNPYIVLNLAMIAVCSNISITINIDDLMIGVNTTILNIINDVLMQNDFEIRIDIVKNSAINTVKLEKVVFIDRINDYNVLKKNYKSVKFIPYQGIDAFCDSEEYEGLLSKIYDYALNMNIDIDLFDEEDGIEEILKFGKSKKVLLLTKAEVVLDENINKDIYVNKNPFENENQIFNCDIIKNIIECK